jgi:hypothetical protein
VRQRTPQPFSAIARLTHIENLALIISPSQVSQLKPVFAR